MVAFPVFSRYAIVRCCRRFPRIITPYRNHRSVSPPPPTTATSEITPSRNVTPRRDPNRLCPTPSRSFHVGGRIVTTDSGRQRWRVHPRGAIGATTCGLIGQTRPQAPGDISSQHVNSTSCAGTSGDAIDPHQWRATRYTDSDVSAQCPVLRNPGRRQISVIQS